MWMYTSTVECIVWSKPAIVFFPGFHLNPLYLIKISFGKTSSPPNFLTPNLLPAESFVFYVELACIFVAKV